MRRLIIAAAATLLTALPAAAETSLKFAASAAPYQLRVTVHVVGTGPSAACTPTQAELFRTYFAGYLERAHTRLVAEHEAANGVATTPGTVIGLDFDARCHADGGATLMRHLPDQPFATQYFDPETGQWAIVG